MCFELDSLPPIPVVARRRRSRTRTSCSRPPTATASPPSPRRPSSRPGRASSSCRTSAASTASTRSSRCASPSAATRRSRSTTSAARPASASATTTSRTRITSPRRRQAGIQADVRAAVDAAPRAAAPRRSSPSASASAARNSWLAAAGGHGLAGAVGFYGGPGERQRPAGPDAARRRDRRRRSSRSRPATTRTSRRELNAAFDAALSAAGVEHELVVYDGAPHSFFDRRYEEHAEASADAWQRVLDVHRATRCLSRKPRRGALGYFDGLRMISAPPVSIG